MNPRKIPRACPLRQMRQLTSKGECFSHPSEAGTLKPEGQDLSHSLKFAIRLLCWSLLLPVSAKSGWAQTRIVTDDITHFWEAHDRIVATTDRGEKQEALKTLFLDRASPGQLSMIEARRYTPDEYIEAIEKYPRFFASIRRNMQKAPELADAIRVGIERMRTVYPGMQPADVCFTVGVFRSGGTALNGHVLLGSEISLADASTDCSEFPPSLAHLKAHFATRPIDELVFLCVHEFVHTQQPGVYGYDLLSRCVHEGIAEFVAAQALDRESPNASVIFARANREKVRAVFEEEMFSPRHFRWLWSNAEVPFGVRDLGYGVGFAIAQSHLERSVDKRLAIAELVKLNCESREAVEMLVDRSGYLSKPLAELREEFEARRPRVTGVGEFGNGSREVDPGLARITFAFSEPMDPDFRSTGAGDLGLDHFPEVSRIEFAEDGCSVTYSVTLKPDTHYQMILEEGYGNRRGLPLVPFRVEFWTKSR